MCQRSIVSFLGNFEFKICTIALNGLLANMINIDYFMVGERVRFLFTSCEESETNE